MNDILASTLSIVSFILLIILSILPTVLLWLYINKIDKDKEPDKTLIKMFFGGALAVVIVIVVTILIYVLFPSLVDYDVPFSFKGFIYIFFLIGIVEEASKFLMFFLFGWKDKNMDETYDVILYSMIVALGFATLENFAYAFEGGIATAILRIFTAVPGHVIDGSFMGYFLCKYKLDKNKKSNLILALLIPTLTHTIYDFLALTSSSLIGVLFFVAYTIIEFVIAYDLITKAAKSSRRFSSVYKQPNFCSNCGQPVSTNFCPNCGNNVQMQRNS